MQDKIKIVLDACVPIDLNIPKVDFLETCLRSLNEEEIYISLVNFNELKKDPKIQKVLKDYNVKIIPNNESDFDKFYTRIESLKLNLDENDAHVLFLALTQKADFVVSTDHNVYDKTDRYRKRNLLKFMRPMRTVSLLYYLYKKRKISFEMYIEKSLNLFKHKEIGNIFLNHLCKENFKVTREEQINILKEFEKITRNIFQDYKNPLIEEVRQLKLGDDV